MNLLFSGIKLLEVVPNPAVYSIMLVFYRSLNRG